MSYTYRRQLAAAGNFGRTRPECAVQWLVFHYTANDGDTDEANARFFAERIVQASAHYFVDDDSVTQSVSDLAVAWSVGGGKWADCANTGGGQYYGLVSNYNSISIEMCDTVRNGRHDFSPATLRNAAELGAKLCVQYGIGISHVICHFDVNGKHCPGVDGWIGHDRSAWDKFREELIVMTGKEMAQALDAYYAAQGCPESMRPRLEQAMAAGITDGSRPGALIPVWRAACMCLNVLEKARR